MTKIDNLTAKALNDWRKAMRLWMSASTQTDLSLATELLKAQSYRLFGASNDDLWLRKV